MSDTHNILELHFVLDDAFRGMRERGIAGCVVRRCADAQKPHQARRRHNRLITSMAGGWSVPELFLQAAQRILDILSGLPILEGFRDGVDAFQNSVLQRHPLPVPHQCFLSTDAHRTVT
ncbi:MAG: hypothetical protein CFH10_00644 [Alphaproteobacteria bacterium MarineAlpha4_Bin2]|nr:MAG: hypothetical protein CFH10_00644 [Alphaproteobacteria bacterium MarineAlpha4_Bin2]